MLRDHSFACCPYLVYLGLIVPMTTFGGLLIWADLEIALLVYLGAVLQITYDLVSELKIHTIDVRLTP